MAFTNSPEISTYASTPIPLVYTINARNRYNMDVRKDAGLLNLIPKKGVDEKEDFCETRLPINAYAINAGDPLVDYVVRGVYVWEKTAQRTYYFAVVNEFVYASDDGITWGLVDTLTTTGVTDPVGFTEFIDTTTNAKTLILVDGVQGVIYTSDTPGTFIVDPQFPTPHLPYPVYLDGYLFLAKYGTGDIYNSDLNTPSSWTAGDFINSELYPDDLTAIAKVNNYLLAIGKLGCEYFLDAANASGSPLARYEGASLPFGCAVNSSIATNKNTVVFLANNSDGEISLKIIEDFKTKDIPCGWLVREIISRSNVPSPGTLPPAEIRGFFLRQAGEFLYVIRLDCLENFDSPATFAYSFSTQKWVSLSLYSGLRDAEPDYDNTNYDFPVTCSAFGSSSATSSFVGGTWTIESAEGFRPFFGPLGPSNIYSFAHNNLYDMLTDVNTGTPSIIDTCPIYQEIRTPNLTFETLNKKAMHRFGIFGTSEVGNDTDDYIYVQWSDDDFNTYSSARQLQFDPGIEYPFITQLGMFRQRTMRITYCNTNPKRFYYAVCDINKGQQ